MTGDDAAISDLTLERYHLAELPGEEAARLASRIERDADLRHRLAALVASDAAIAESHAMTSLLHVVGDRTSAIPEPPRRASRWWAWPLAASLTVVALMVAWRPFGPQDISSTPAAVPEDADIRVKGELASLMLFRRTETGSETLTDGEPARGGDIIRLGYRAASPRFGVIVSIDGAGVVTRHLPMAGAVAVPLDTGATVLLDSAYELDNAPRWEQFFLVVGERAFDVDSVMAAARRAATGSDAPPTTLPLPATLQQSAFLLRKVF